MTASVDDPNIVVPAEIDPRHDWSRALRSAGSMHIDFEAGMAFALEPHCPASDGFSVTRIGEEVLVTSNGCKVLTLFPAEESPLANLY